MSDITSTVMFRGTEDYVCNELQSDSWSDDTDLIVSLTDTHDVSLDFVVEAKRRGEWVTEFTMIGMPGPDSTHHAVEACRAVRVRIRVPDAVSEPTEGELSVDLSAR